MSGRARRWTRRYRPQAPEPTRLRATSQDKAWPSSWRISFSSSCRHTAERSSRLHDREGVTGAVVLDRAGAGEGEVVAADHHLVGDHPLEQRAAGGFGCGAILVVLAAPARIG